MISEKLVTVQKHPSADLFIYNYSPTVQYEKLWNEITLQTRGLILDSEMNYVARPFSKFFNYEEHKPEEIPLVPFQVFDKLDGSLGILYWIENEPYIATRGSFTSKQALHATSILHGNYSHSFSKLEKDKTYLFEIIYPENRIVVNYGKLDDIILLAIIDNETGLDLPLPDQSFFKCVNRYDGLSDLNKIREIDNADDEGFVILFSNGMRLKMKFKEYVRLHRIITGVSNIAIWEYLAEGKPFDELLDRVPDEFYDWVKKTESELTGKFTEILNQCNSVFMVKESRKETALYFQTQKYPPILFLMLDEKSTHKAIWKLVRPAYSKPFKNEI